MTPLDAVQHFGQTLRRNLLLGVAPCLIGVDMTLDDQPVEVQVDGLLRYIQQDITSTADMRWIVDHHQTGIAAPHLDGQMPHGRITVFGIAIRAESTMDKPYLFDTGLGNPFHSSCPQFQVGVDGVLDQHGHICTTKGIRHLLYAKWIYGSAGAYPQYIHVEMQG